MKAYGIPRTLGAEYPDKADIKKYGRATTDRCSRKDRGKNNSRRYWKKRERRNERNRLNCLQQNDKKEK